MGPRSDADLSSMLHSADLWLTRGAVGGFDPADFTDWGRQDRENLEKEVASFLAIAEQVLGNKPATKSQSQKARKHLETVIDMVRRHLLPEWLEAQRRMLDEATAAARAQGWFVERDEKEVVESLLGTYKAPRLRIRTENQEVVLDPIALFGSGRQGVVDLVVMPSYERTHLVVFKDDAWQIISPHGKLHRRPFSRTTLINTITNLPH